MKKLLLCLLTLALTTSLVAQKTNAPKFGKGLFNLVGKDSTYTMKVGARMQFLSSNSWDINDGNLTNPEANFLVRRARLKFNGFAFTPKLKYKLELGLSNRNISFTSAFWGHFDRF